MSPEQSNPPFAGLDDAHTYGVPTKRFATSMVESLVAWALCPLISATADFATNPDARR